MTIRQLGATDRDAWLSLWQKYLVFYKSELSPATIETAWQRLLTPTEPMFALGAFSDNRLSGIVHIIYHRSTWTEGNYCYLQDLFTDEAARGQGVGTALIEAVYARAKADGASRVYWLTHETNDTARRLYEKIAVRSGFIQYRKIFSL